MSHNKTSYEEPRVLPEHADTAARILDLGAFWAPGPQAIHGRVQDRWRRAGHPDPETVPHYHQAFCLYLEDFSPELAMALRGTLSDHGLVHGVPVLLARYFTFSKISNSLQETPNVGQLALIARYLSILSRLSPEKTASAHTRLALASRGQAQFPKAPVLDPLEWDAIFMATLRSSPR